MSSFMLTTQTPGANIDFPLHPIYHNSGSMNIGQPAPLDSPLRMAYIIAKLSTLIANITLHMRPLYYYSYLRYHTNDITSGKGKEI